MFKNFLCLMIYINIGLVNACYLFLVRIEYWYIEIIIDGNKLISSGTVKQSRPDKQKVKKNFIFIGVILI